MLRTVAVIQARMGSKRLPGKVLREIVGRPMLWHIVHRLRRSQRVDEVVVATTNSTADDPVADYCTREFMPFVRGSEDDVLSRFLLAARQFHADIVVRVNGDAPLVCPRTIDRLVGALVEAGTNYATTEPHPPCIHAGFDPVTRETLERLAREAGDNPVAREHVTAYFKEHPDFATTTLIANEPQFLFEGARVSVDTPADVAFIEEVHRRLDAAPGEVDLAELVELLSAHPELLSINAHVRQKQVTAQSRNALVRCDGNASIGMGHVVRCLAVADALREREGFGVRFACAADDAGTEAIRKAGFPVDVLPDGDQHREETWLDGLIETTAPDAIVADVRTELPARAIERWRAAGHFTVVIDDPSPRRLAPDLAIFPPVPQLRDLSWEGMTGALLAGWEWLPLRPQFASVEKREPGPVTRVLVTAGGSDPGGLTLRILEGLEASHESQTTPDVAHPHANGHDPRVPYGAVRRCPEDLCFDTTVVVGSAFVHQDALERFLAKARGRYRVERAVEDMAGLMANMDLAVVSFGVTAYELAAVGVPSILLGLTEDHARSAEALSEAGAAIGLGVHERVDAADIAEATKALLEDADRRRAMGRKAAALVDGRGAKRIARRIREGLEGDPPGRRVLASTRLEGV